MKKWFENLQINRKLKIGFLFVSVLGIVIGVVGIINLIKVSNDQQESYDQSTMGIVYSTEAESSFLKIRTDVRDLYIYYETDKDQYSDDISKQLSNVETQINNYSKTISSSQDQENFNKAKAAYASYKEIIDQILQTAQSADSSAEVLKLIEGSKEQSQNAADVFESTTKYNTSLASERVASDRSETWVSIFLMIGITILSFIFALLLSAYISGVISKPLIVLTGAAELLSVGDNDVDKVIQEKDRLLKYRKDEIGTLALSFNKMISSITLQAQQMQAIADGDLTTSVTVRSEFDVVGKALSELVNKFQSLIASIVSSAGQVDSGARLVADSSTSISQGASEQASSVEELTASLEGITLQTEHNAKNAQDTDKLARNIKTDAEASNDQMAEMLHAMDDIKSSSDNIRKIIKVIDDIAFQTNILALNAAVEAARAGQYGKGFAVVADEVRNLAAKSTKAAKETTDLIESSIAKVGAGTTIASETADTLSAIVSKVSEAASLIDSIASASNEQASALEQINQGVMQVSQVIQNNAAASEECASASEELSSQAIFLKDNISIFKLEADDIK